MAGWQNPLLDDRDVDFLLDDVFDLAALTKLAFFSDHDRETFGAFIASARRVARTSLYPAYRAMDAEPPRLVDGRIIVHPRMHEVWAQLRGLGVIAAPRRAEVGGQQLPLSVYTLASVYLMAANLSAYGYAGLTQGAAHLIEAFGSSELRERYMTRMYSGEWTGTMALTEPQAGSSLSDVATIAVPAGDGSYRLRGNKIFISGGDHDLAENVVHMTLARIEGAPAGIKGVSLFCVPRRRVEGGALVDNDVATAGMIHKIGWRGLPSLALSYGERGDCHGWLVGEPHRGIAYMFQMMNEARIMVGLNGVATAAVAYQESLEYARTRPQGRPMGARDVAQPQVPIIEHADVRRMLLRQKTIVEGALALLVRTSLYADHARHGDDRARVMLDLLTPVAKSFPAERGFEANALAVQVHGGYGYSSEYPVEAWLRDQKLNSIHEGTTGIQALDLLGRRALAPNALATFRDEVARTAARAREAGIAGGDAVVAACDLLVVAASPQHLAHATDYLDAFSTVAIAWQWLELAAAAAERAARTGETGFTRGKRAACAYWLATELPRVAHLIDLVRSDETSFTALAPDDL
ncbi:MAG: acyl-CoA dehydrogenase [Deltaproteobacteria bacterium]|nr:acyl-CoA dehydrogenase [Deltaproteobacteria bacterium]